MAAPKGKSTAQRVDEAFRELTALRKKYGFPQVVNVADVNEGWHMTYSMPHAAVTAVRQHVQALVNTFGKVPWEHDPYKGS